MVESKTVLRKPLCKSLIPKPSATQASLLTSSFDCSRDHADSSTRNESQHSLEGKKRKGNC